MILASLLPIALGVLLLALVSMGLYTRRFCQKCDYCGQFYWWIGWAAFEWTSVGCESWAMRCKHCQWLAQQLRLTSRNSPQA
jgi:hypothetical protein